MLLLRLVLFKYELTVKYVALMTGEVLSENNTVGHGDFKCRINKSFYA